MRNISDKICREIQNTRIFIYFFFFSKKRAIYEIIWINIVEPYRLQMPLWGTCIACLIPKATDTHSEYVIHIAFPLQQWLDDHVRMLRYMHIASLVIGLQTMYITAIWKVKPYSLVVRYQCFRRTCFIFRHQVLLKHLYHLNQTIRHNAEEFGVVVVL